MSDYAVEIPAKMLVSYLDGEDDEDGAVFVRTCPNCGRFVRADLGIHVNLDGVPEDVPNATCKKCGRVKMPFFCWESDIEVA